MEAFVLELFMSWIGPEPSPNKILGPVDNLDPKNGPKIFAQAWPR